MWQIIADNKALIIVAGFILAALLIRWVLTELRDAYRNNDYQGAIPSDEVRQ
ncbi:hypothetical protein [Rhodomicrobium sp.]|uniref:hypothetical protein n=1 Tax=Rhodomicrobium sp. TaxID=2720632 RepID=UPI0039E4D94B